MGDLQGRGGVYCRLHPNRVPGLKIGQLTLATTRGILERGRMRSAGAKATYAPKRCLYLAFAAAGPILGHIQIPPRPTRGMRSPERPGTDQERGLCAAGTWPLSQEPGISPQVKVVYVALGAADLFSDALHLSAMPEKPRKARYGQEPGLDPTWPGRNMAFGPCQPVYQPPRAAALLFRTHTDAALPGALPEHGLCADVEAGTWP